MIGGEAIARNFLRWPIIGQYVWPNFYVGPTLPIGESTT